MKQLEGDGRRGGAEVQLDTGFVWRLDGVNKKAFIFTPTLSLRLRR